MANPLILMAGVGVLTVGGALGFAELHAASAKTADLDSILEARATAPAAPAVTADALGIASIAPAAAPETIQLAQVSGDCCTYPDYDDETGYEPRDDDDFPTDEPSREPTIDDAPEPGFAQIVTAPDPAPVFKPLPRPRASVGASPQPEVARRQIKPTWMIGVYR